MSIATVTYNPALDITTILKEKLNRKEPVHYKELKHHAGGGGICVARAIRGLVGPHYVTPFGFIGGPTGASIKSILLNEYTLKIDGFVELENSNSRTISYLLEPPQKGRYGETRVQYGIAGDPHLNPTIELPTAMDELIEKISRKLPHISVLVISGSLLPEPHMRLSAYDRLIDLAKEKGKIVILDTRPKVVKEVLLNSESKPDIVKMNREEFGEFTKANGMSTIGNYKELNPNKESDLKRLRDAIARFHDKFSSMELLLVTLGRFGFIASNKKHWIHAWFTPTTTVSAGSATGGGDTVVAGLAIYQAAQRNQALKTELTTRFPSVKLEKPATVYEFIVAAATATAQKEGSDVCESDEVLKLLRKGSVKADIHAW